MSTIIQEQPADVVIMGLGPQGGFIAAELTLAGYNVVGIDKGPYWDYTTDFSLLKYDEWGVLYNRKFDHPLRLFTYTMRNNSNQLAIPVRRNTANQLITPGHGVGGMAQHYGGMMGRFGPWVYQMESMTASRYGSGFLKEIQPYNDVEDWPTTYEDYDPYYVKFENAFGVTGTNEGPFQPQSANFPMPAHPPTKVSDLATSAAEALGYTPFATPTSLASEPYTNSYGIAVNACIYDGYCGPCNFVCETGAKANSAYRTIPAAMATGKLTMALNSYVFRVNVDTSTGMATDVMYYDAEGNVHSQPGTVIYDGLWGINQVRMEAMSGIGPLYNPATVTGSVGRGPQSGVPPDGCATVNGTLNFGGNAYPAGNALGGATSFLDLADDNFNHTGLDFIGGGYPAIGLYPGAYPSGIFLLAFYAGASSMGSAYKAALKDYYLPTTTTVSLSLSAPELPDQRWYIDLDPNYLDAYGDPLGRYTVDSTSQPYNGASYLSGSTSGPGAQLLQKMGCSNITVTPGVTPGSIALDNWPAHIRGGIRIGSNSSSSAYNSWGQSWSLQNFFAGGEITDTTGDNTTTGGTHPMSAQVYVVAEGIEQYLKSPGSLVT